MSAQMLQKCVESNTCTLDTLIISLEVCSIWLSGGGGGGGVRIYTPNPFMTLYEQTELNLTWTETTKTGVFFYSVCLV